LRAMGTGWQGVTGKRSRGQYCNVTRVLSLASRGLVACAAYDQWTRPSRVRGTRKSGRIAAREHERCPCRR
jgi:hypothetical protein